MSARILFLDDNPYEMAPLVERLKHSGYEVAYCRKPADAKAWLDQGNQPDLLLCDLMMQTDDPNQTPDQARYAGVEFCKHESARLKKLGCPVLVLTGVLDAGVREAAQKVAHPHRVLEKPIASGVLIEEVKKALANRRKSPLPSTR